MWFSSRCAANGDAGFDWKAWGKKGKGRWTVFERGDLKFVILRLIAERPMHGYDVMRALEEESCGWYTASAGSVYPTLQMLDDQGYLRTEEGDGKKIYHITEAGLAYLDDNQEQVDDIFERIRSFTDRFFGQDMRDLTDAFANLAEETFQAATSWVEDTGFLQQMKDILDQAAGSMEEARDRARGTARAAKEAETGEPGTTEDPSDSA